MQAHRTATDLNQDGGRTGALMEHHHLHYGKAWPQRRTSFSLG